VTKYGRGTAEYSAPEILLFEPDKPAYTNKVDIWALGCILYELTTGERAFQTGYHAMQYSLNQRRGPCVQAVQNTNLSIPLRPVTDAESTHFNQLWHATTTLDAHLNSLFQGLPLRDITNMRLLELNRHLTSMLQPNPANRPAIDYASLNISASRIRCKMESDTV
jgi:serine/threonine protein kinase